jgi:hypothetical protein
MNRPKRRGALSAPSRSHRWDVGGKQEPLGKDGEQAVNVFATGNAPKQNHFARSRREHLGRTLQGPSKPGFICSYRHANEFPKLINPESSLRWQQSPGWRVSRLQFGPAVPIQRLPDA